MHYCINNFHFIHYRNNFCFNWRKTIIIYNKLSWINRFTYQDKISNNKDILYYVHQNYKNDNSSKSDGWFSWVRKGFAWALRNGVGKIPGPFRPFAKKIADVLDTVEVWETASLTTAFIKAGIPPDIAYDAARWIVMLFVWWEIISIQCSVRPREFSALPAHSCFSPLLFSCRFSLRDSVLLSQRTWMHSAA